MVSAYYAFFHFSFFSFAIYKRRDTFQFHKSGWWLLIANSTLKCVVYIFQEAEFFCWFLNYRKLILLLLFFVLCSFCYYIWKMFILYERKFTWKKKGPFKSILNQAIITCWLALRVSKYISPENGNFYHQHRNALSRWRVIIV